MDLTAVTPRTEAYADGLLVVAEAISRMDKAQRSETQATSRPAGAGGLPATSARLVVQARPFPALLCLLAWVWASVYSVPKPPLVLVNA